MATRARTITNAGSNKVIGKFPSVKMNEVIWWESQIERDYIYLLEIDPDVISYKSQPFSLNYWYLGKKRKYTPDFWVQRPDKEQVIEVKPASKINSQKNTALWKKITTLCEEKGWEFIVVTDEMIRIQPQLDNIKLLYKYARTPLSFHNYLDCKLYFLEQKIISFKQAAFDLASSGISHHQLYKLLYTGWLETDLSQPIGLESLIRLSPLKKD